MFVFFRYSAGVLLLLLGCAKLVSSGSSEKILDLYNPVFPMTFRCLLIVAAGLEILVSIICFCKTSSALKMVAVGWISTNFLLYRIALHVVDYHKPCKCLGDLTDALHLSSQTAEMFTTIILAYLLIGSYVTLFWLWRQGKKESTMVL